MNAHEVVAVIEASGRHARADRDGWYCECAAHESTSRESLHVSDAEDRVLVHCFAGCPTDAVLGAYGLTARDLWHDHRPSGGERPAIVETYPYTDEAGELLFEVVRFEPKGFRQRRPDGEGGYVWKVAGTRRVLYRLPKVIEAVANGITVYVAEGERDVRALEAAGVVATCNPGGAGKWRPEFTEVLRGADVVVVADRDEAGRRHAGQVAAAVREVAGSVTVVEPLEGKDAADHLAAGRSVDAFISVTLTEETETALTPARVDARAVTLTPAIEIRSEAVRWLWDGRIPMRGETVIAGEKGLGKSILTNAWMTAQITRGTLEGALEGHPADALVLTAEDDWRAIVKPRLMAHGADLERVHRVAVHESGDEGLLTLPDDVQRLEDAVVALRDSGRTVAALVIDPIGAFLSSSTDSHRDADVHRTLAPLAAMADRLDLAITIVAHLNKDASQRLISRVSGSGAFVNAARSVFGFVHSPDDPDGEEGDERVLVHVRTNWGRLATSLAWRVEERAVTVDDGSTTGVGYLVGLGETTIGIDDVQRGSEDDHESIEAAIVAALDGKGARSSLEVKEEVSKRVGCTLKTVERHGVRMRDRGELETKRDAVFHAGSTWALTVGTPTVGTSPRTPNVPTGGPTVKPPINTGVTTTPPPSRDTPADGGPTGATDVPTGAAPEVPPEAPAEHVLRQGDDDEPLFGARNGSGIAPPGSIDLGDWEPYQPPPRMVACVCNDGYEPFGEKHACRWCKGAGSITAELHAEITGDIPL